MSLGTPVALIVFNRPQHTQRMLAEVAKARPSTLLIIADGPRPTRGGRGVGLSRRLPAVTEGAEVQPMGDGRGVRGPDRLLGDPLGVCLLAAPGADGAAVGQPRFERRLRRRSNELPEDRSVRGVADR